MSFRHFADRPWSLPSPMPYVTGQNQEKHATFKRRPASGPRDSRRLRTAVLQHHAPRFWFGWSRATHQNVLSSQSYTFLKSPAMLEIGIRDSDRYWYKEGRRGGRRETGQTVSTDGVAKFDSAVRPAVRRCRCLRKSRNSDGRQRNDANGVAKGTLLWELGENSIGLTTTTQRSCGCEA